jgi:death on curing protein
MTTNPAPGVQYLDVADYLLIAEPVVGLDAAALLDEADIELAELALHAPAAASSGVEFYADLVTKAAVLCVRLVQFRTLPSGNKRVAYLCMIELLERNGRRVASRPVDEVVQMMTAIEQNAISLSELADWIKAQLI